MLDFENVPKDKKESYTGYCRLYINFKEKHRLREGKPTSSMKNLGVLSVHSVNNNSGRR